jgi:predicted enzyme related to lactoylglutathione lyase
MDLPSIERGGDGQAGLIGHIEDHDESTRNTIGWQRLPPKERTMIKGLRGASIWSDDLKNLLPFYRDVLGLKVGFESPGFVVFGEPATPALALGTHSEVRGRNADPARHMVGLASDDVTSDWRRLTAAGVEFVENPTDYGRMRIATLKDPEGNLVQLMEPLQA